jgi:hypothetical protein
MTKRPAILLAAIGVALAAVSGTAWSVFKPANTGTSMTTAAHAYLATLSDEQKASSVMAYGAPQRLDWHFIPKAQRKGLQIKHMSESQRQAAFTLLQSALSEAGYDKARKIMSLENLLLELEKGRTGTPIRDTERYYYTVFGEPGNGRWGLSIEGHHLSLNFVVEGDRVVSSTPTFFAANPTIVTESMPSVGVKAGTRVLAKEELLAFELLQSLNAEQRAAAVIADKSPDEIRAAGDPQAPAYAPDGLAFGKLMPAQQKTLKALIGTYAMNVPEDVAKARIDAIEAAGPDKIYFAWAGADKPGVGHYYRVQGPTFLIEFVNTQPDAAGNPASHIHCVWRDPTGDFAIPVGQGL